MHTHTHSWIFKKILLSHRSIWSESQKTKFDHSDDNSFEDAKVCFDDTTCKRSWTCTLNPTLIALFWPLPASHWMGMGTAGRQMPPYAVDLVIVAVRGCITWTLAREIVFAASKGSQHPLEVSSTRVDFSSYVFKCKQFRSSAYDLFAVQFTLSIFHICNISRSFVHLIRCIAYF